MSVCARLKPGRLTGALFVGGGGRQREGGVCHQCVITAACRQKQMPERSSTPPESMTRATTRLSVPIDCRKGGALARKRENAQPKIAGTGRIGSVRKAFESAA